MLMEQVKWGKESKLSEARRVVKWGKRDYVSLARGESLVMQKEQVK
jgi:hypothetical protein